MASQYQAPSGADGGNLIEQGKGDEKEGRGCMDALRWFKSGWYQSDRYGFAFFALFGLLTIIWLIVYFSSGLVGFVCACVAGIFISCYGAKHFKEVLGLREQVDRLKKNNQVYHNQNVVYTQKLGELEQSIDQLNKQEMEIREANGKMKENYEAFQKINDTLQKMGETNLAGLGELAKKSQANLDDWHKQLHDRERTMLMNIYEKLEMDDREAGMTEDEFDHFLRALPPFYSRVLKDLNRSWHQIAGDDKILEFEEFSKLLDDWIEEICKHGGSHAN